jgi:hypothetical protein
MAPDVASGPEDRLVLDEASVLDGVAEEVEVGVAVADGVAIIQVELSVAITIVLTSSVDVGLPIVAGTVFMVEDVEEVGAIIVAVIV